MGTNFYLRPTAPDPCPHCGRSDAVEERHIGKSSAGWCFSLHVYPEDGINDLDDWRPLLAAGVIVDEYGDTLTETEMLSRITERGRPDYDWDSNWWAPKPFGKKSDGTKHYLPGYNSEADFHRSNGSERGPNGMLRHRIDGRHCIAHGAGTWDCMVGEFS